MQGDATALSGNFGCVPQIIVLRDDPAPWQGGGAGLIQSC